LTFIINKKEDLEVLYKLIDMKKFEEKSLESKMTKYVHEVVRQKKLNESGVKLKNRVYMYLRILKNINKMADKIWDQAQRQQIIESDEEEIPGKDPANPIIKKIYRIVQKDDSIIKEKAKKGVKELKEINLPCRFFNYKKSKPSNYNYIRTK
jgi:hypothetical protein